MKKAELHAGYLSMMLRDWYAHGYLSDQGIAHLFDEIEQAVGSLENWNKRDSTHEARMKVDYERVSALMS